MELKYKIIITIFVIIVAFYFIQFIMSQLKPRENYMDFDDNELYEKFDNPPPNSDVTKSKNTVKQTFVETPAETKVVTTPSETKVVTPSETPSDPMTQLRYWLFTYLSKNVSNQTDRNNIYDIVSTNDILTKLLPMNITERTSLVNSYISKPKDTFVPDVNATAYDTNSLDKPMSITNNTSVDTANATIKDHFTSDMNPISDKLDKVITNLNSVTEGLIDIKNTVSKPIQNTVESKPLYKPVIPELFTLPKIAPLISQTSIIEGFENIRHFANY